MNGISWCNQCKENKEISKLSIGREGHLLIILTCGHDIHYRLTKLDEKTNEKDILTFGELKIGQKFIAMPSPGDNAGHGGYRIAHYIFTKTRMSVKGYAIPHGRAIDNRGVSSDDPNEMPVILVE